MDERLITIGNSPGISFKLRWTQTTAAGGAETATHGKLTAWLHEDRVWGSEDREGREIPLEWSWVELLEFLSHSWPYLKLEPGYPLGLRPTWPAGLRDAAEARWQTIAEDRVNEEQEELFAFEETHDLARGLHGLFVPSIWLVREGDLMRIGTAKRTISRRLCELLDTLEELAEAILARISNLEDARSRSAVAAWNDRLNLDPWSQAEIATKWTVSELKSVFPTEDQRRAVQLENRALQITEPLEIAGLTRGYLGVDQLKELLGRLDAMEHAETPLLEQLTEKAEQLVTKSTLPKPYDQAYVLANWLRREPGIADADERVDIEAILSGLGIRVMEIELGTNVLDAVACWGPRHGPAIWINRNEKHEKNDSAKRSTLAHELCHLLIDRKGALPLADVINGNAPKWVEQRAEAFAAELLLPRELAVANLDSSTEIIAHVHDLSRRFGVSRELTAWQIRNAGVRLSPSRIAALRGMVSRPEMF